MKDFYKLFTAAIYITQNFTIFEMIVLCCVFLVLCAFYFGFNFLSKFAK